MLLLKQPRYYTNTSRARVPSTAPAVTDATHLDSHPLSLPPPATEDVHGEEHGEALADRQPQACPVTPPIELGLRAVGDIDPSELDLNVDEDTLVCQYDVGDGVTEEVFGGFDAGGLEEADADEDEDEDGLDLSNDCESFDSVGCLSVTDLLIHDPR